MLSDCDGAKFRRRAADQARALERGVVNRQTFLGEFQKSTDPLVAELVDLIRREPRQTAGQEWNTYRFELDRVLLELEEASNDSAV